MNRNTFRLASLLSLALGLMGAGPGSCGSPDPDLCAGLDEQACLQTDGCEPVYYELRCACAPCPEGVACPPCDCGMPEFASCSAERPEPPPPADRCAGLEEFACMVEPGCAPTYFASEPGVRCDTDRCLGGYAGCVEVAESCASLDEAACVANPKCEPIYWGEGGMPGLDPSGCMSSFVGCRDAQQVCPAVACMMYCEFGMARDENGCEICACNAGCSSDADCGPGQRCDVPSIICLPDGPCHVPTGVCVPAQRECRSDADCAAGERCEAPVINCLPEEPCPTFPGLCVPAQRECRSDADCASGERCDVPELICLPDGSCPVPTGLCVPDQICPPVLCDLWCENGFARDEKGCETCRCNPGCFSDSDCAAGERCDRPLVDCASGLDCGMVPGVCVRDQRQCTSDFECAPGEQCVPMNGGCSADGACPAPTGICVATGCEPVACDLWCPNGFVRDERGCEICACQPAGCSSNADCAEGEVCEFDTVACPPGAVGCFNLGVCKPVAAGCASDADCSPGQVCESFATCTAIGCPPPPPSVCVDRACQADSDCAAGTVCRPDPKDPCSGTDLHYCLVPAHICQAPCAGLDEAGCVARADCAATYVQGGGWCGNEMVFSSCSDR